jgi:phosphonate transport system substrate-binding protein
VRNGVRTVTLVSALVAALGLAGCGGPSASGADPSACPNGGTVRMGVQPFLAATKLVPAYQELGKALSAELGCTVTVNVTTDYAAETEAMRAKQLEIAEFPPFGYVLAKDRAGLVPVATFGDAAGQVSTATAGIAVLSTSPVTELKGLAGHSVAFTAPTATSGHLLPAAGLKQAGIDPNTGISPVYLGTHTAVYQALLNNRVDAAELASTQIAAAKAAGAYDPARIRLLWTSAPSPSDPIVVRDDLTPQFRQRLTSALLGLDFASLSPEARNFFATTVQAQRFAPADDSTYSGVRAVVATLGLTASSVH